MHGTAGVRGREDVKRVFLASIAATLIASVIVLFLFDPARVAIFPVCVFHKITGLDCPGCGSLRALHQLLNGNLLTALRFNPMLILSLPLFACLGAQYAWRSWKGRPAPGIRLMWIWIYGALWIVFGIARNLPNSVLAHAS